VKLDLTEMAHQSHMGSAGRFQAQKDRGLEKHQALVSHHLRLLCGVCLLGEVKTRGSLKMSRTREKDCASSTLVFFSLKSLKMKIHFKSSTGR